MRNSDSERDKAKAWWFRVGDMLGVADTICESAWCAGGGNNKSVLPLILLLPQCCGAQLQNGSEPSHVCSQHGDLIFGLGRIKVQL